MIFVVIYQLMLNSSLTILLFFIVNDANKCFQNLSNDLCIISNWAYQRKMSFNPDRSKQAQDVIFSRKTSI